MTLGMGSMLTPCLRAQTEKSCPNFHAVCASIIPRCKEERMEKKTVESELADLERKFWTAIMEKDAVVALQLSHDHCVVTGSQGACPIDPASYREIMDAAPW